MNTQFKFVKVLREQIERIGLELVQDQDWANTGTLRVQRPGSFADLLTVSYNFQSTGQTLILTIGGRADKIGPSLDDAIARIVFSAAEFRSKRVKAAG